MSQPTHRADQRQLPAGKIEVAPQAIASLVACALADDDRFDLAAQTFRYGVAQGTLSGRAQRGIEVRLGAGMVEIDVYLVIAYGAAISDVVQIVEQQVRVTLEQALGMSVIPVHVRVQGFKH